MKTVILALLALGSMFILGCEEIETTSIETPSVLDPNTSFEITMNIVALLENSVPMTGHLAIIIPEIWSVDSVYADGYGYSGPMVFTGFSPPDGWDPPTGYVWYRFKTPVGNLYADSAEVGYAIATIMNTDSLGEFQLASLAGAQASMGPIDWETVPCICMVEVTPVSLEQETWGQIKSGF